jgi:hypothetical protein
MQQRRGTAAEWTAANPILQAGEIGYETDTEQFKIGNGTDTWSALEYWEGALPDQTSNSGKFLTTDGTDAAWADVDTFPSQSGNSGYFLTTDGTAVAWAEVDALPTQTGNTGYYLKTDGTTASWDELSIDDLVAVSLDDIDGVTITGTPAEGQSLIYDSSTSQWINVESGGSVSVSATAPVGPDHGDMWWNSEDAVLYVYYVDVDADGYWVEATAGPLLNQALADLSDTNITSPTIDQTLVYNGTQWVNQDSSGGGLTVSATPPAGPDNGDMWFSSNDGKTYVYYSDGDSSQWVEVGASVSGEFITVSSTAPTSPEHGALWWDPDNGNLYIYYTDVDSSQWVSATGPQVFVGTTAPAGYQGQLWFNSSTGKTYIYFDDGTSAQWVSAIGGLNIASSDLPAGSILQVVSTTKTDHFTATPAAFTYVDVTGLSASITPISTSSTILVIVNVMLSNSGGRSRLRLMRDATEIGGSSTSGFGFASINPASGTDLTFYPGLSFSDAPATTSELTYKIQGTTGTTSVAFIVNKSNSTNHRGTSSITLMEVAG